VNAYLMITKVYERLLDGM